MVLIYGVVNQNEINSEKECFEIENRLSLKFEGEFKHSKLSSCSLGEKLDDHSTNLLTFKEYTITSSSRLDNYLDLCKLLNISSDKDGLRNSSYVIIKAFIQWGRECVTYLKGDWAFTIWNNVKNELFISSDPMGNNGLYYVKTSEYFKFSSSLTALIPANKTTSILNENFLLSRLQGVGVCSNESVYKNIYTIAPGTNLLIDISGNISEERYYKLENTKVIEQESLDLYIESFIIKFKSAILKRIPDKGKVASSLSGGLDSSSVSALTAIELEHSNRNLTTYTSVPAHDITGIDSSYVFFDESILASATASKYKNIVQKIMTSADSSILDSLKSYLHIHDQPGHAMANAFWIHNIFQNASDNCISTFFVGQAGNASISWSGLKPKKNRSSIHMVFSNVLRLIKRSLLKNKQDPNFLKFINPLFLRNNKPYSKTSINTTSKFNGIEKRCDILQVLYGMNILKQEKSLYYNIDILDPTRDKELVEFCLSIPDRFYRHKEWDRLLIRHGMKDYLPEEVLWNKKKGKQASDIGARIKSEKENFTQLIREFKQSEVILKYLNLDSLLEHLTLIVNAPLSLDTFRYSSQFLRAIGVGLFLQKFEE